MMHALQTPSLHMFAAILGASLSACAGSAPKAEASRAPADEAPAPASPETADSASDGAEERPVAAPTASFAAEKERTEEEAKDDDDASPAQAVDATSRESSEIKRKEALPGELRLHVLKFDEHLKAEVLSCDGARPHRDAICSIAERICAMESPSTTKSADCSRAQESCEKARTQYQKKCG